MSKIKLGVNVDHIATIRQQRGTRYPDPVHAALIAEEAGADGITVHLREDRRHIQDNDVVRLSEVLNSRMNLEMAVTEEMINFACRIKPTFCCLVPEKREELTTEGGLDVVGNFDQVKSACDTLAQHDILVSLFIDPDSAQIDAAKDCGAPYIELHTGCYADAPTRSQTQSELKRIVEAAEFAHDKGIIVNAGHGLHYHNVEPITEIECLYELNIGHAIIARAAFVGLDKAVREMKALL